MTRLPHDSSEFLKLPNAHGVGCVLAGTRQRHLKRQSVGENRDFSGVVSRRIVIRTTHRQKMGRFERQGAVFAPANSPTAVESVFKIIFPLFSVTCQK
jgi:hypothetical protein